jgi:hypothetical protein
MNIPIRAGAAGRAVRVLDVRDGVHRVATDPVMLVLFFLVRSCSRSAS